VFAKIKQVKTSNPRTLGLLVFVASLFYFIDVRSIENDSHNYNDVPDIKIHRILISSFEFKPEVIEVNVGDKVVWINKDFAPHNISKNIDKTSSNKGKTETSPNLMETEKFELIIKQGFDYYCGLHPSMTGKIVIRNNN